MKIKSLLLGSAAASMLAVSGAQAADPIIYAEPEAMEYVRICDVYGAGYYYIPGTETCLRIGGYLRMELRHTGARNAFGASAAGVNSYASFTRAAPNWDVRSENEWGTLRGFVEAHFDYTSAAHAHRSVPGALGSGTNSAYINQAFIELGGLRMGKTDLLYARGLGYGSGGVFGATYGFGNDNEISYTFSNAGFTAALALVENHDNTWTPDIQGIVNYAFGGGNSIGGGFAYDNVNNRWAGKGVMRLAIPNLPGSSVGLHVFYAQGGGLVGAANNRFAVVSPASGRVSEWSVLAHASVRVDPSLDIKGHVQWFRENVVGEPDTWQVVGGLNWRPVDGFSVQPEISYTTNSRQTSASIRFQRSF